MHGKMGAVKDFAKLHKRIAILVTVGVVASVGILIAVFTLWKGKSSQSETSYREYTVSEGDVTVGTTESGTVALEDETVALPIDCEIGSVLVKSGTSVKKGDPILQIDLNSVADGSSDTRQKLEEAKISLQSALNDQKAKLETAKITYEASKYLATSAPITRELTQAQIAHDISSAQSTLQSDQKSLAEYETLQKSWAADYGKLQDLEKWMNDAQSCKTSYETQLSDFEDDNDSVISTYESLKSAVDTDEQKYLAAKRGDTTVDGYDEDEWDDMLDEARDSYDAYYDTIANTVITQKQALESKVAQYTAEYTNYSSAYNDYKETFEDKYKSNDTEMSKTEIDDKVTSLKASVETDQYNLEKAQKSAEISSVSAQQTEQTDLSTAENAEGTYQLTVNQLNEAVTVAQDSYDKLQNEMDEINSALSNNGVVSSPCDGIVASVSYKGGQSVTADETILTISGNDSISVSVSVSEDDITNVSVGQEASISLSAYDDQTLDAAVDSITAEPARSGSSSVTYTVVVKSTEKVSDVGTVYDGMSADATMVQHAVENVLHVSDRAITFQDGVSSVLVKNSDGSTSKKTVKTGFSDGTNVEITSGLEKGETVLAESTVSSK
ncbi:HlyD family efflux transporter periplasmic adaptor subunit [Caproiciproducens sp. NJN-50]|uniref:HlyD family efflux transporter periplasmic adaptor subunit n=1 Tax=Acutalibacteraceae TaxID=3082771 RepID=UPI000FFE1A25|nr:MULTISPECIES: HlyD family efflux transporter periplasmic adaptor subunit [Acutalibacteraceae]QAT50773.1 HlyD family efflux transporter periplasmic adaptor subunit [Caproiciproducens sp. NJN-50]